MFYHLLWVYWESICWSSIGVYYRVGICWWFICVHKSVFVKTNI